MKQYTITVEHPYGPYETYVVEAKDLKSARKKAKALYVKDYFTYRNLKTYKES